MKKTRSMCPGPQRRSAGFSLIELLVVVGIIVVMVAIALPAIGQYIRNYKIKSATQEVVGELQAARNKAIAKNVNIGVVFAVVPDATGLPTQYRWVIEDDQNPQAGGNHPWNIAPLEGGAGGSWANMVADPLQAGPLRTLPGSIRFEANPALCLWPQAGPPASSWGLRFTRMGATCDFTVAGACGQGPPPAPAAPANTNYIGIGGNGSATFCLLEIATGIRKAVTVSPGGRIQAQP